MIVNYSNKPVIKGSKSIFLAGPTPRSVDVKSWRIDAIKILEELGYDGIVYVPEREFDDRTFDYDEQYWWERDALHYATSIVFWIPRDMKTLPALTTNGEYGKYSMINIDKIVYGRPDNAEKMRWFDKDYYTESGEEPINNLRDVLKKAIIVSNERENLHDLDTYELNIIKRTINKYPEILNLIGEVHFSPESFGRDKEINTYGNYLFNKTPKDYLKEFDRTILSVLLYYYIKDDRYDKFTELQIGPNKLTRESFNEIRSFMLETFDNKEKEELLVYYMVINDLGKSEKIINKLKEKGVETVDHDELLGYLVKFDMLPSLNKFSEGSKTSLLNVLDNGVNVGQYIFGESVDYSFNKVLNLNKFEKDLMIAEATLDIGGVMGHFDNFDGSVILNQSTVENILLAKKILSTCQDKEKIYSEFLNLKADSLGININNSDIRKTIVRICLMMKLYEKDDIKTVESEILNNLDKYQDLIYELSRTGYDNAAILLYYSPALLRNVRDYYNNMASENPVRDSLKVCLPFLEKIMNNTRKNINVKEGIVTIMLEEAAKGASVDPSELNNFDIDVLSENEVKVKKR